MDSWKRAVSRVISGSVAGGVIAVAASDAQEQRDSVLMSNDGVRFRLEVVLTDLEVPSATDFLPDGTLLLAERPAGRLNLISLDSGERTITVAPWVKA